MLSTNDVLATVFEPFEAVRRESGSRLNGNGSGRYAAARRFAPLSLYADEERVFLEVDLPGLRPDDVDLTFEDGKLWIRGRRSQPERKAQCRHDERSYGEFERIVAFDETIDPGSIDAKLEEGVLTITLSKKPEAQPRRIEVKARQ